MKIKSPKLHVHDLGEPRIFDGIQIIDELATLQHRSSQKSEYWSASRLESKSEYRSGSRSLYWSGEKNQNTEYTHLHNVIFLGTNLIKIPQSLGVVGKTKLKGQIDTRQTDGRMNDSGIA